LSPDEWAKIIDAFWAAVARLLPTPFDPTEAPGDWVLFKATGVNTMHRVLADCLPIVIQRGARLADPDQYEMLMSDLPTLLGFEVDPNTGQEREVDGSEFWRSASIASRHCHVGECGRPDQIKSSMVPVAWKMTRRPISTAWSAKRS
jgi:hypothetical protein